MANGHGGRRPGAGRKPKTSTIIKQKAIEEAGDDAEFGLGLFVATMRNEEVALDVRLSCAKEVMDRVWGKATQRQVHQGAVTFRVVWGDGGAADSPADAA